MATTTRDRILDVAAELFLEQGYDGTSLRQIADRMGFSKAALYYHFQSKEEIMRALVAPIMEVQSELHVRLAEARTLEDWAAAFEWGIAVMFDNFRVFALLDRNRAPIEALAAASEFFADHRRWHDRIEDAIAAGGRSFEERVRLTCALGALAGFDDFGKRLIEADPVAAREQLVLTLRQPGRPGRHLRPIAGRLVPALTHSVRFVEKPASFPHALSTFG